MPKMAASTFLKLMSQRSEEKLRDLSAYDRPGGYDAHRNLRLAIAEGTSDGTIDHLHDALSAIPVVQERARALELEPLIERKLLEQSDVFVTPPQLTWTAPNRGFSVNLHPDVGMQQGNHVLYAFLYFHSKVRPTSTTAGALIHLAKRELGPLVGEADEFAVIDVRTGDTFKKVMRFSPDLLAKEVRDLDSHFGSKAR